MLKNKLVGYADHSSLISIVPSPAVRVTFTEILDSDVVKVTEWCDHLGIK